MRIATIAIAKDTDFVRGLALMERGEFHGAIDQFSHAILANPISSDAYANRGLARFYLKDWVGAEEDVNKALSQGGSNWIAFHGRGLLDARIGHFREAIADFSRAIELNPGDRFAFTQRALAYESDDQMQKALADAEQIAPQDFADRSIIPLILRLLVHAGRGHEAVARIDAMIARDPRNPDFHAIRANILLSLDRKTEARASFVRVVEIRPNAAVYLQLAELRDATDRATAYRDVEAAEKLDPRSPDIIRMRAWLMTGDKDYDRALALIDNALKIAPADLTLLGSRSYVNEKAGNIEASIDDLERARRLMHDSFQMLNAVCRAKGVSNVRLESALADCDAGIATDPYSYDLLVGRALVNLRMGRYADAVIDYDRALVVAPRNASALFGRGIAQLKSGRIKEGEADLAAAAKYSADAANEYADYGLRP
jgi:tetratricopeptide (TPR) repeat protein